MTTETIIKPKTLPELHETTQGLSAAALASITVDSKTGHITIDTSYEKLLPIDLPMAMVKAVKSHEKHLIAALADAVATASLQAAKKHPNLTVTDAEFDMSSGDRFDVTWTKSVERNAGIPKAGEVAAKKTVYGTITGKLTIAGADTSIGELNKVAKRQKAAAMEMFGPK